MNHDSQVESNPQDQSASGLFSMFTFTGLQNLGFIKKKEEAKDNPPENISDIQLLDASAIQIDQTERAISARHQGGRSERSEDASVVESRTDRIELEQPQSQIITEIKKDESITTQKTTETGLPPKYRSKRNPIHSNLIQYPNTKNDPNGLNGTALKKFTPQKADFKSTMREYWNFLKFFFKYLGISLLIMFVAEFTTFNYDSIDLQYSICLLMDGCATGIALALLVHNLLHQRDNKDVLLKTSTFWKIHLAVIIITTGGTNLLGYILYHLAFAHPMWILLIKAILIFINMMMYALYLSNRRERQKRNQQFSMSQNNDKRQVRTFFNAKVYKDFIKEIQDFQKDLSKKTVDRNNKIKNGTVELMGKDSNNKPDTGPIEIPAIHQNQLLKGRHNLNNMLTFRKGFLFGVLITLPILQLLASVELIVFVEFLASNWLPGVYIVSAAYPMIMYLFKLLLLLVHRRVPTIMTREYIEYFCITFAALPIRFFPMCLTQFYSGFILIPIKFLYKSSVYLVYALLLARLHKKLGFKDIIGRVQKITAKTRANAQKAQSAPTTPGKSINEKQNNIPTTPGNEKLDRGRSKFRLAKKSIFEQIQAQERKQIEIQQADYKLIVLKFKLLTIVDVCDILTILIGTLALRIFPITHPLKSITYDNMWYIAAWNLTELPFEIIFYFLVNFIWRRNKEFNKILDSIDILSFLGSHFRIGIAFHLITYFSLFYFAANFWNLQTTTW